MRASALLFMSLVLVGCQGGPLGGEEFTVPDMRVEGNVTVPDSDLVAVAERYLKRFVENDRRRADADDAAFAMQSSLRAEGYAEAEVTFAIDGSALVFHVAEGPLAEFGAVRFEGAESLPAQELEKAFEFEGSGFLWLGPPVLDPQKVASAVSAVESTYREAGFLRVEVENPRLEWNAARTKADVVVRVQEGKRYTVAAVTVAGAEVPIALPVDVVGKPYTVYLAHTLAAQIRKQLRNQGYAFAEVEGTAEIDDETALARIRLAVDAGEPTRLHDIRFDGNDATQTDFLRNRFELRRGRLIRRDRMEAGIADLYRSKLFQSVRADVVPTTAGWADLAIDVVEADTKHLDLEVGWGSWEMLYGGARYRDMNLFGRGRILRVNALAGFRSYGGEIKVEDPWTLGQGNRVWVALGGLQREERFYDLTAFQAEVALERRIDRHHRLWGGFVFALEEAANIDAAIPPDEREDVLGFQRASGPYVRFERDTRNDRFIPTEGLRALVGLRLSARPLGASLSYVEAEAEAAYHFDLKDLGVLAIGASLRTRMPFDETVMPIQQRYFLGGALSVRSFGQDELTPTDSFGNGIGGLTAVEANIELRPRIHDIVYGAVFGDVGQVSRDGFSFDGAVGFGFGLGLRIYTPVGPVRLDGAYNPGPLFAASSRFHLHASFGFSF